jgi:hypothetical protein
VSLPSLLVGLRSLTRITQEHPDLKLLLALAGAFTFVVSALKIPSVTGSSSHPTGTGLGAILFGPLPSLGHKTQQTLSRQESWIGPSMFMTRYATAPPEGLR